MRRRTGDAVGGELRTEVAARLRARAADYAERLGPEGEDPRFGLGRAERLVASEPVLVYAWELPPEHPAFSGSGSYVLDPDGRLKRR